MPETREGQRWSMYLLYHRYSFWLVRCKLVYLRDDHWWGFLKSPIKAVMWLDSTSDGPSGIWKQGQDFSSKIYIWFTLTHEWITPEFYTNFRGEKFQSKYYLSPIPESCFCALSLHKDMASIYWFKKNTSKKLNGLIGCIPTKLWASSKIIFKI